MDFNSQNNMQNDYVANVAPAKKSFSVKSMWIGIAIGFFTMMIIAAGLFFLWRYLDNNNASEDVSESSDKTGSVKSSYDVLDKATIKKLEAILGVFYDKSILDLSDEEFQRGIIDGLVKGSGDKYAQYYTPEEITELMGDYGGKFYGIGASLSSNDNGAVEVQSVYKDSPSEKAGIREGDIIEKVDGKDITGIDLDRAVDNIRGDKGTEVVLTIYRPSTKSEFDVVCVRDEIKPIVVEYEMKENNIGYIHIMQWYDTTSGQFADALAELNNEGMNSLIIDLRSNTGGLLSAVVAVGQQLLPKGTIVYTENKTGRALTYTSDGTKEIQVPVVILTNGYTASASEILTGAMKDHGKAITMGTNTYGKGVVQGFTYFSDGSAMKLTTEQYFTPNGTAIDGVGIAPDVEIEFDGDAYYSEEKFDNQLQAAIDYLKN